MNKLLILLSIVFLAFTQTAVFAAEPICEDEDIQGRPMLCDEEPPYEEPPIDETAEELADICNDPQYQNGGARPGFCGEPTPEMEEEIEKNPACAMVICLSIPTLKNSGACLFAQKEFFGIKVKVLGVPDVARTIIKRTKMLDSCDGSRKVDTVKIIAMYGSIM